jgi:hypothetical protein
MREIRPYGSVRGVRRNPYPYRDTLPPDAEGSAGLDFGRFTRRPAFSPSVRPLGEDEYQVSHSEKNDPC